MQLFKKKDWRTSKAHLLLLSKFLVARSLSAYKQADDYWKPVLGETATQAITRFRKDGMVEPAPLADILSSQMTVAKLKPLLQDRGLPVKGKKANLIESLIAADPTAAQRLVTDKDIYTCSSKGRAIAEPFVQQQKDERLHAEQSSLEAIQSGNYRTASRIVRRYEAAQVFPRGMGIDWSRDNPAEEEYLRTIGSVTPKALDKLSPQQIVPLRHVASMLYLWGMSEPHSIWWPQGFVNGSQYENKWASLLILSAAHTQSTLHEYARENADLNVGIVGIQIRTGNDDYVCPFCQTMADVVIPLQKAKTLAPPFHQCTSELGCRCGFSPVLN